MKPKRKTKFLVDLGIKLQNRTRSRVGFWTNRVGYKFQKLIISSTRARSKFQILGLEYVHPLNSLLIVHQNII